MRNLSITVSAVLVARFMKSVHGSIVSSSVRLIRLLRSVAVSVLLTSSSSSLSLGCSVLVVVVGTEVVVGVGGVVVVVLASLWLCRRGVPITSRSIRLCVRCSCLSMSLVSIYDVHPYRIVGVTVLWKSCSRDFSGYVLLVSSFFSIPNLRHAAVVRLSNSFLW